MAIIEIMLEIGFVEEMTATWGNKEVILFNFKVLLSQEYNSTLAHNPDCFFP